MKTNLGREEILALNFGLHPIAITLVVLMLVPSGLGYWEVILRKCATVEEVIQWYNEHNMGGWWYNQAHWADASRDAVVISAVLPIDSAPILTP